MYMHGYMIDYAFWCDFALFSVLANVKQFLPLMKEANKKLETIPAEDRDIECISESDQKVIEMVSHL